MTAMSHPSLPRSRCTVPREDPLEWVDRSDPADQAEVELVAWIMSLSPFARTPVLGAIAALRELAAAGEIAPLPGQYSHENDLKPIRDQPEVFELRWKQLNKMIRQYHAEPAAQTDYLFKLHAHIKTPAQTRPETKKLQDVEIEKAVVIHNREEAAGWPL